MKDTIIKETGNSRFLRSNVAEDITFSEFISLLRAGQLPIDLAGINEEGIETLGMALSKGNLLNEETEMTIWGDVGDRTPTNALKKIYETFSAGLTEKAKIVTGTYTGNDATNRTISLGFTPKAVLVIPADTVLHDTGGNYDNYNGGLAVTGKPATDSNNQNVVAITDGGFIVRNFRSPPSYIWTNSSSYTFNYIAIA